MVAPLPAGPVAATGETLAELRTIARAAGQAILAHYHAGVVVTQKGERGPVTAADHAAHAVIVTALTALDPATPVISEEGDLPDPATRQRWTRFWLVDPLDGTKEFLHRNGEFTVNIALIERGVPVLGVIHAPALGTTWFAGDGLGAWKQDGDAEAVSIHSQPPAPGQPLRVAESRSHPSPELEAWLKTVPVAARVGVGSSLKFCLVAEGRADVYPRLGPTMEWDVAAGDCIYRHSGSPHPRSSPLVYNQPDLRNPGFILGLEA
jgi:3'(2'), 5'-bisphosphate nucleotidase